MTHIDKGEDLVVDEYIIRFKGLYTVNKVHLIWDEPKTLSLHNWDRASN